MIVDTSVWINYLAGFEDPQTNWMVRELSEQEIGITDLILCEVLQGIRGDAAFLRTHRRLSALNIFSTAGEELAVASARNYRFLRTRGQTIRNTIDCLIATFCIGMGIHCCIMIATSTPSSSISGLRSSIRSMHKPRALVPSGKVSHTSSRHFRR